MNLRTKVKPRRALSLPRHQQRRPWPLPLRNLYEFHGNLGRKKKRIILKGWKKEATYIKRASREKGTPSLIQTC